MVLAEKKEEQKAPPPPRRGNATSRMAKSSTDGPFRLGAQEKRRTFPFNVAVGSFSEMTMDGLVVAEKCVVTSSS